MRVIAGLAKGRKLQFPTGTKIRPAMDRVREDLFNILGSEVYQSRILDVFAGTGSVGIEALSRGAQKAVFVENDISVIEILKKNLTHCGFLEKSQIARGDFRKILADYGAMGEKFHFIFVDPPYHHGFLAEALTILASGKLILPETLILIERHAKEEVDFESFGFTVHREKKFGQTHLFFLKHSNRPQGSSSKSENNIAKEIPKKKQIPKGS